MSFFLVLRSGEMNAHVCSSKGQTLRMGISFYYLIIQTLPIKKNVPEIEAVK